MFDLAAVNLTLKPIKTNTVPGWLGRATQAHFLYSLQQLNPNLAAIVHDGSRARPFTASNLLNGAAPRRTLQMQPDQTFNLRYTTLHPHLTALLLNGLVPQWWANGLCIHDQPLQVTATQFEVGENPWTGHTTYETLLAEADGHANTIHLHFSAPTAFKKTGGGFVPLPLPELVFGSLLDRWNLFSPIKLSPDLFDAIVDHITVTACRIETHEVVFKGKVQSVIPGFVGQVTYRLDKLNRDEQRAIHALVAFALYSGVGVKTTMGMGQVRA